MPTLLVIIAIISVLVTFGIVITLLAETIEFFKDVPFLDFFTGTILKPLGDNAQFGIIPLVTGTINFYSHCDGRCHSNWINVSNLFK